MDIPLFVKFLEFDANKGKIHLLIWTHHCVKTTVVLRQLIDENNVNSDAAKYQPMGELSSYMGGQSEMMTRNQVQEWKNLYSLFQE